MQKPIAIFIMGRPGAGKDTQAELLAARFNLEHIMTSDLIQQKFQDYQDDPTVKKEKKLFDSGALNTPQWVVSLIKERIEELASRSFEGRSGIIFSGSPRTRFEVENLEPVLEEKFGRDYLFAIYLDISESEGIKRILKRGARALDRDSKKIHIRMSEYDERTKPVLEYFSELGLLQRIDGTPTIETIAKNIQTILEKKYDFL